MDPKFPARAEMTFWEYAIIRASLTHSKPPNPATGEGMVNDKAALLAQPFGMAIVLFASAFAGGLIAWIGSMAAASHDPLPVVFYLVPVLGAATQLWQFTRGARAMRMVWAASKLDRQGREALLVKASTLQPWWS